MLAARYAVSGPDTGWRVDGEAVGIGTWGRGLLATRCSRRRTTPRRRTAACGADSAARAGHTPGSQRRANTPARHSHPPTKSHSATRVADTLMRARRTRRRETWREKTQQGTMANGLRSWRAERRIASVASSGCKPTSSPAPSARAEPGALRESSVGRVVSTCV
eukprot:2052389-Rhodomonas_salina.2